MTLSRKQVGYIASLDLIANQILSNSDTEALLMSLAHKMNDIKSIIDSASDGELDYYCNQYKGFSKYMELLQDLAQGCADGIFDKEMYS